MPTTRLMLACNIYIFINIDWLYIQWMFFKLYMKIKRLLNV